jgi:hypothetical protein
VIDVFIVTIFARFAGENLNVSSGTPVVSPAYAYDHGRHACGHHELPQLEVAITLDNSGSNAPSSSMEALNCANDP